MFDKDLFLSLCEKYDVELSDTVTAPMIREGMEVRSITDDDVNRIFSPRRTYFGYSGNKISTKPVFPKFNFVDDYAIAC